MGCNKKLPKTANSTKKKKQNTNIKIAHKKVIYEKVDHLLTLSSSLGSHKWFWRSTLNSGVITAYTNLLIRSYLFFHWMLIMRHSNLYFSELWSLRMATGFRIIDWNDFWHFTTFLLFTDQFIKNSSLRGRCSWDFTGFVRIHWPF